MDNQLEAEFRVLVNFIGKEIDSKLEKANKLMNEAIALSEKYGVPFRADVSSTSQSFTPRTYQERFQNLDEETAQDILGMSVDPGNWGWERSAIC